MECLALQILYVGATRRVAAHSCQSLVAGIPEPATTAAMFVLVGAMNFGAVLVNSHIGNQVEQCILQIRSVIHGEVAAGVVDDSVRRAFNRSSCGPAGSRLPTENMRVVGRFRRPPGLDLDRDDLAVLFDR